MSLPPTEASFTPVNWHGNTAHKALSLDNSAAAVYSDVTVSASLAGSTTNRTGKVFIPRSAENFTYDPDGNLASDGRWTYTWDCENRLITLVGLISGVVPNRIDFEYDYLGRRIKKTVTTGSTVTTSKYLYRGGLLVGELNGSNGLLRSYMWGLDLSGSTDGAGGVGGLLAVKPAGGPAHFAGYDGNGNVTALVNGNDGSTSAQYEYGPFGELIRMSGAMAASNPIRFSSKFADDETDLIYYGFRYYNPSTGRWLCRDPIGEAGGMNLYAFARNLSLNAIDPWGLIEIPAGVQEYINAYQAETGTVPWVGWWDTHQNRAFNGWFLGDDYELYGLVWYPTWVDIALENRPPGTGDLPYGHVPTNKYGSDPTKKYSLIAMWADELDAAKDLAEGAIQAKTFRDDLGKDLLWGLLGGVAGKLGGKVVGESIESISDWRTARNVGKIADNGGLVGKGPLFSGTSGAAMDSAEFSRIQSAFQRSGGVMQADAESTRLLQALGKEGAAIDATTIILRQNPSRSAVFEELIHSAQYRRGMTDATQMEIEAAEKLIRFRHNYKIPNAETRQTIQNLRDLRGEQ